MEIKRNPWHDIKAGAKIPEVVNAIIEIPKGSSQKYELDKETGFLKLDRTLFSAIHYPGDYGFVPQTLWDDGDPLDIIILTNNPVYPMTLTKVRVIGVIRMIDSGEKDDKLIGVYEKDPRYAEILGIRNIPKHILTELKHFFERYKELEGKKVKIPEILGKDAARKSVTKAIKLYEEKFGKTN